MKRSLSRSRHRLWLAIAHVCLIFIAAGPPGARAAFESPAAEPSSLALGSASAAWPFDRLSRGGEMRLFGAPPPAGLHFATLRWDAVPGLEKSRVSGQVRRGPALVVVRLERLSLRTYSETSLTGEIGRPVEGSGWSWAVGGGRESWRAGPSGESGWVVRGAVGYAPRPELRTTFRFEERPGGEGAGGGDKLEMGLSGDPLPGWRFGAAYETARGGGLGRLQLGVSCRAAPDVDLKLGLEPSQSAVSTGLSFARGPLAVEVSRRSHPRLGSVQALSLHLGGGGSR